MIGHMSMIFRRIKTGCSYNGLDATSIFYKMQKYFTHRVAFCNADDRGCSGFWNTGLRDAFMNIALKEGKKTYAWPAAIDRSGCYFLESDRPTLVFRIRKPSPS